MTSLQALITALLRLLGIFYIMRALDNAAAPLFTMIMQFSAMPNDPEFQLPNPWMMFLPVAAFYLVTAALIFVLAPRLARMMIGSEAGEEARVPLHETLLFCSGVFIVGWSFVRITDTFYGLVASAANNDGRYSLSEAMLFYLFMTAVLLGAGILLIAKFHRVGAWIAKRRAAANKELDTKT